MRYSLITRYWIGSRDPDVPTFHGLKRCVFVFGWISPRNMLFYELTQLLPVFPGFALTRRNVSPQPVHTNTE